MREIVLTYDECTLAETLAEQHVADIIKHQRSGQWNRSEEEQLKHALIGYKAEIACARLMCIPYTNQLYRFKQPDVGEYHIRATDKKYGSLIIRPSTAGIIADPIDATYILGVVNNTCVSFHGWMTGRIAMERYQPQRFRDTDIIPLYLVPQHDLFAIETLPCFTQRRTCIL